MSESSPPIDPPLWVEKNEINIRGGGRGGLRTLTGGIRKRFPRSIGKSGSVTETVGVTYANMIKCNYMEGPPLFSVKAPL